LRAAVRALLEHREGIAGSLTDLCFADVVQSYCLARRTTAIRVICSTGTGAVYVERGETVNATFGGLSGEAAFYRMLMLADGHFSTAPLPADVTRLTMPGWQHLLLEGTRQIDEACPQTLTSVGAPRAPDAPSTTHHSPEVSRLIDEGFERLRAGRRDDARFAWEHALELDPSNKVLELNLRKLGGHASLAKG
jgi:hypothetical protein